MARQSPHWILLLLCITGGAAERFVLTFDVRYPLQLQRWDALPSHTGPLCPNCTLSVRKAYGSRLVIDAEDAKDLDIMQQFFAGLLEGQGLLGVELDAPISIAGPDMLVGLEKHRRALLESDAFLYPQQAEEFNTTSEPYTHPGWGWPYQGPWSLSVTDMWDQGHGDPGTVVAVLDTGIVEGSLPLFQNLKQGYDFVSYDDGQRDPDFFDDDSANCQHGTKMSSIIAAAFEEPGYFHPMAKNASLLPIRTVLCGGGSASDLADSVFWAIGEEIIGIPNNDAHASILSISLAGLGNCPSYVQSAFDKAAEKGVKVFVSAGNYHGNAKDYFPANCNNITAVVMASDYGGRISSFSNRYGTIAVPGETIPTLAVAGGSLTTTHSTGTSASTALAAGYTALGMGIYGNEFKITDNLHTFDPGEECKAEDCGAGLVTNAPQDTIWPLLYPQEATCAVGSSTLTAEEICAANDANTCVEATNPTCRPVEVVQVVSGKVRTCFLRSADQGVACFGYNGQGQLGTDNTVNYGSSATDSVNSLVAVNLGSGLRKAKHLSAHIEAVCAVREDNGVVCWGNQAYAQLGSGSGNVGGGGKLMSDLQPLNIGGNSYNAKEVHVGNNHVCVLTLDNTVMCWGTNSFGQLGNEALNSKIGDQAGETASLTPLNFGGHTFVKQLSVGHDTSCIIRADDDSVRCFGRSAYGVLGDGQNTNNIGDAPGEMAAIPAVNLGGGVTAASSISVGQFHVCAVRLVDGGLVCWGAGNGGALGRDSTTNVGYDGVPALNDMVPINLGGPDYKAQKVFAGDSLTAVIRDPDSSLVIFGVGVSGVRGQNDGTTTAYGDKPGDMENITPLTILGRTEFDMVTQRGGHICARFKHYKTFTCWGRNFNGALGRDDGADVGQNPGTMETLYELQPNFVDLSYYTGTANPPEIATCAVGSNTLTAEQICTDNNAKNCETATDPTCRDMKVKKITSGYFHNCAIRSADSQVVCFGGNNMGQLGRDVSGNIGSSASYTMNNLVGINLGGGVKQALDICTGSFHSCAIRYDSTVVCWGSNQNGILGQNLATTAKIGYPGGIQMDTLTPIYLGDNQYEAESIWCGTVASHMCAVRKNDKRLICWGAGSNGQNGISGDIGSDANPMSNVVAITLGTGPQQVLDVAIGNFHTCARKYDQKVYCFGKNHRGQLGIGSTSDVYPDSNTNFIVLGEISGVLQTEVSQVSCGEDFCCALLTNDASVRCWGYHVYGRLGNEAFKLQPAGDQPGEMESLTPLLLGNDLYSAIRISAGFEYACAVRSDHKAVCWGRGLYGQTGLESTTNIGSFTSTMAALTGIQAAGQDSFRDIVAGNGWTYVQFLDGTITGWGTNSNGQLGRDDQTAVGSTSGSLATLYALHPNFADLAYYSAIACPECPDGQYSSVMCSSDTDTVCEACSATCSATEYESTACTPTTNRECTACTTCTADEYQTSDCTLTTDRQCTAYTVCTAAEYESVAYTPTTDRECTACTVCAANEYETSDCTATADRVCAACTVCESTQLQTSACEATADATCVPCPEGYGCDGGPNAVLLCPEPCNPGEYPNPADNCTCTNCTADSFCTGTDQPQACTSCNDTDYVSTDCMANSDTVCSLCPAGFECNGVDMVACTAGYTSAEGDGACSPCPDGDFCLGGGQVAQPCSPCNDRWVVEACSATQDVVCVHQGSEWAVADVIVFDDWLSDADMQLLGTQMYDSLTDASIDRTAIGDCTGSPDLQACRGKVTGNAVCRKSDACPAGKQFDSTEGGCVPCPLGSYSPDFSTAACIKCPAGRYSDVLGAKKCKSCAWHTYSDVVGAVSQDACTACPENFFTDSPAATSLSDCLSCPIS